LALVQELAGTSVAGPIAPEEVKSPAEVSNDAALKIVVRDAAYCRSWIESRYFNVRWIEVDLLYQSPPTLRTWEGTQTPKANIAKFTVATHVNAISSKLIGGLFYEEPPFNLIQRPNADVDAIRAVQEISSYQLDEMNFKQEVKYGLFSCLLNGTGIWKWGWKEYYETEVEFEPFSDPKTYTDSVGRQKEIPTQESDRFTMRDVDHLRAHPYFENCDIRMVLVDPGCRTPDIRDAKFVIHEFPVTYRDLMAMKDEVYYDEEGDPVYRYDLPSEDEIRSWFTPPEANSVATYVGAASNAGSNSSNFVQHAAPYYEKTTEDPLDEPLIMQERWDKNKVMTVLNGRRLIRNERNPVNCVPFYSVNWWMIQDCFWGIGLGTALGGEQRLQQGFINQVADMGTLTMNQPIIRSRGANINTQQVRARLGGFIDVDGNAKEALHPMDLPKIQPELFEVIAASEARTESTSGANELLTMGATPSKGKTSLGRTATGAGGLIQAAVDRLGGLVEDFNRQVFQPWLWQMYDLNRMFLPPTVYREVLNEQLGDALEVNMKRFLTGKKGIKNFQVLAGAHLAARQQMAQAMPLIMQYFTNPAIAGNLADIQGEYVDFSELLHMMTDISGFGAASFYSVIKKLTPAMKAQRAQQNSGAQKIKSQQALQSQRAADKANLSQQEWTQRAAGDIIRHSIETAGNSEAITGAPGGAGLGGSELEA
jgi:hypothetical protein